MIIGLFVLIGSFLTVAIILFIQPNVGDGKQILKVRFNNISGINVGTRVTYAGKEIGEVTSIEQVRDARKIANDHFEDVYPYLLTLRVDSHYLIYTTDDIVFQTKGLLGERYIGIIPRKLKPGQTPKVATSKDILFADSTDLIEGALNEVAALSSKFEEVLNKVMSWIDKYGDNLGSAITEAGKTLKDFNDFQILADVKTVTKSIAAGNGTLGRIIMDDGLYLQISALMTKANTLLNDVNQYGLMFHYNKEWQRRRIKKMAEANRIKDPKAFRAFMDKEIDEINTTLERMQCVTNCIDLEKSRNFRSDFKQLMQQIKALQDRVNLYNQELNEMRYRASDGQTDCRPK